MRDPLPAAADRPRLIGVGNAWRRDDGAGPAVAAALGGDCTDEPSRLLDLWAGAGHAIVVDASRSGAPPGTVRRFDATTAPLPAQELHSTHGFGVAEAIELARVVGRLPARVEVYAIEGTDFRPGTGLTPPVARAVDALVAALSDGGRDAPPRAAAPPR